VTTQLGTKKEEDTPAPNLLVKHKKYTSADMTSSRPRPHLILQEQKGKKNEQRISAVIVIIQAQVIVFDIAITKT